MAIKWSDEQLKAIEESNKSILVNAGAGSGKTAVLAERLLRKVQSGVHLENLIVLTFTKLAASEMKERLRKILIKNSYNNELLKKELEYIDQANIQTFDAFTNELVRKYHYLLNIPSSINIVNSASFEIELQKIMKDVFSSLYDERNQNFLDFIDTYTTKDDGNIINYCCKLYKKMSTENDYEETLNNYEGYLSDDMIKKEISDYEKMLSSKTKILKSYLMMAYKYTSDDKLAEHYDKVNEIVERTLKNETYDDFLNDHHSFPRMPLKVSDEDEKASYSKCIGLIKDVYKKLDESLIYASSDEIVENFKNSQKYQLVLVEIMQRTDKKLKQYKYENNTYDFNDIALMAISILKDNDDVREKIKFSTNEILVDEYQDTSDIQEKLINLIENNNVYMVGDVKQSIYRFRYANPDIFKNKYQKLKNSDRGMVIDLSKNFRSRQEVLNDVNNIFEQIMSSNVGGVDYNESHTLKYGNHSYDDYNNREYEMELLTYTNNKDFLEENPEFKKYSNYEIEAFIIGKNILSKLDNIQIYDKELGTSRDCKLSDFAILTSTKDKFDSYKKIFEYLHIPLRIYKDEAFIENDEIYVIANILKLINCLYEIKHNQDYSKFDDLKMSITSFLRSFIIMGDDKIISKIITSNEIINSFRLYFPKEYEILDVLSNDVDVTNLNDIVDIIYEKFDIYSKVIRLKNIESVELRLNYLKNIINDLTKLNYSLNEVVQYFDTLIKDSSKLDIQFSPKSTNDGDTVKMMTIHASKGLEFPICYFSELYKKFNFSDLNDLFIYSKDYKFILPYKKDGLLKDNICKEIESYYYHKEEVSEKIRLLYVALTRPREQMILVCPEFLDVDDNELTYVEDCIKEKYTTFKSMFDSIYSSLKKFEIKVDLDKLGLTKKYLNKTEANKIEFKGNQQFAFLDVNVKKEVLTSSHASKETISFKTKDELNLLDAGTEFHKKMEYVNFKHFDKNKLTYSPKTNQLICDFMESSLIKSLEIIETYHEYQYSYEEDNNIYNGIIDLLIETKDQLIIVDYKLSHIDDPLYEKQINTYKSFLKRLSQKEIKGYLYSIYQKKFKEVL